MPQQEPVTPLTQHRAVRLLAWLIFLGVVWLVVLPWWAARPHMHEHLQWLDEKQVDPSAMYYTELEAMQPILTEMYRRSRQAAHATSESEVPSSSPETP